ncbi:DUF1330 domain-containing protein [Vibrio sp.]|uniref:DUF1330 domain-containing protein n=1 Tax=Vibrio sp. TaxID=678 RepID=UPI003D0C7209
MKGYWLAHVTVHDTKQYSKYTDLAPQAFEAFNGKFLARGGRCQQLEGDDRQRHVVIEFASFDDALACYHSEAYQQAATERKGVATAEIVLVEGV